VFAVEDYPDAMKKLTAVVGGKFTSPSTESSLPSGSGD